MSPLFLSAETLGRFDIPGPRYTSYPTADRFTEGFVPAGLELRLQRRVLNPARPLSLYVRAAAMVFDRYLQGAQERQRFSRIV
jgi:hypothetical protein